MPRPPPDADTLDRWLKTLENVTLLEDPFDVGEDVGSEPVEVLVDSDVEQLRNELREAWRDALDREAEG